MNYLRTAALAATGMALMIAVKLLEWRFGPNAGYGSPWGRM